MSLHESWAELAEGVTAPLLKGRLVRVRKVVNGMATIETTIVAPVPVSLLVPVPADGRTLTKYRGRKVEPSV